MKYIIILLTALALLGCTSSDEPNTPNPEPTPQPSPEPSGPIGYDDSYQKEYLSLNQFNLPIGECKNIGEKWSWQKSSAHEAMQPCSGQAVGDSCSGRAYCKINNLEALSCRKETTYACHGWVYERQDPESGAPSFKPLEDAKVYNFNFMGSESSRTSKIVRSDENGYFEFQSTNLGNQVRSEKSGYYHACAMSSPFPFAGSGYKRHLDQVDVHPLWLRVLDSDVDCTK